MSDHSHVALTELVAPASSSSRDILTAAKGGGIVFFGDLFAYACRFVFGIVVARAIGAAGYGLYDLGVTASLVLAGVAVLGLPSAIVHFLPVAASNRDEDRIWGMLQVSVALGGAFGLVLALVTFLTAGWAAEHLFHEPALAPMLRIASASIPLVALGRILQATAQGFKEMRYIVYADSIFFNVGKLLLTLPLLIAGWGATGALVAYVVTWIGEAGLLVHYVNRLFSLRRSFHGTLRNPRQLLSFSLPMWLQGLLTRFGTQIELLLMGMLGTIVSVGVYSSALRIQMIGSMLLRAVQTAAKPIISDLYHRGEYTQLNRLYRTLTKWALVFNLPFFLTIVLYARPVLAIFGEEFTAGMSALVVMAVGTLVSAGTGISGSVIAMTGHSKLSLVNAVASLTLSVTLDVLLIPAWGLVGGAMAFGLTIAAMGIVRLLEVYWLHGFWPYDFTFGKLLVGGCVASVFGFVANRLAPADLNLFYLVLNIALLWSSYAGMILLLGLSEEDQMVVDRIKRQFSARVLRAKAFKQSS